MRALRLIYDVISFSSGNHGLVCESDSGRSATILILFAVTKLSAEIGDNSQQSATGVRRACVFATEHALSRKKSCFLWVYTGQKYAQRAK